MDLIEGIRRKCNPNLGYMYICTYILSKWSKWSFQNPSPRRMYYDNTSPCSVAYMTTSWLLQVYLSNANKMVTQSSNRGMEGWHWSEGSKTFKKKKFPLAFGWKIFPIPHMDNDSQLIQHIIISFFLLCANLMDISNKLAKHNNKYK